MGKADGMNQVNDSDQSSLNPTPPENTVDTSVPVKDANIMQSKSEDQNSIDPLPGKVDQECLKLKLPVMTSSRTNDVKKHLKEANSSAVNKMIEKNEELPKEKVKGREESYDNWFSWMTAAGACLIYLCNGGVFYSNGLLLPEFTRMLGCGEVVGTWISSVQMGLCQFVCLLGGALIDLYGCRAVSLAGSSLITIGLILSSFVSSVPLFFLTYSVIPGIGLGLQFMPCIVVVQYHFTAKRRATATGLASSGSPLGLFVFGVLTQYLLDRYALRGTLMLLGALNAHALIIAFIIWPFGQKSRKPMPADTPEDAKEQRRLEIIPEDGEPEKYNEETLETDEPDKPKRCVKFRNSCTNFKQQLLNNAKELGRTLTHLVKGIKELRDIRVAGIFISCLIFCIGYQTPYIFMPITVVLRGHGVWRGAYLVSVLGIL